MDARNEQPGPSRQVSRPREQSDSLESGAERSDQQQGFQWIDVPRDNSCLFWAVTLAHLIPVKNDDALFQQRYEALFGNKGNVTQSLKKVKTSIRNYNLSDGVPDINSDELIDLIRTTFRNRVVEFMSNNKSNFIKFVEEHFDEYLDKMRNSNTWGGELEISAMSEMLGVAISVSGGTKSQYGNGNTRIQLIHENLSGTGGTGNHYKFRLQQNIINNYQKKLQKRADCDSNDSTDDSINKIKNDKISSKRKPNQPMVIQQEQSQSKNENTSADSQSKQRNTKNAIDGNIYQLKLLMLFLKRGVSHGYSFRLGTEIEEAAKFDDLVFEYTEGNDKVYRFLQAKHKLDESKKITVDSVLTESDGDYSLIKYFFSFQDVKKEKLFKSGSIKDVIICTNIDFDLDQFQNNKIKLDQVIDRDDILDVESVSDKKPVRYRFNEDFASLLKPKLENYNLNRLARRLAECFLKSDCIRHHQEHDIFESYHIALAEEVIDVKNKKFRDKFIKNENISEDAEKFRKSFAEEIKKKTKEELSLEGINEAIINKKVIDNKQVGLKLSKNFGKLLIINKKVVDNKQVGLKLSKNFGKGEDRIWPKDVISNDEIKDFLSHLVFAVNQPNEDELGKIVKQEIGKEFDLITTENVYNKLFMTMLNWLQGKERDRFLSYEEGKEFFEEARRGISIWFDVKGPVTLFTGRKEELSDLHSKIQRKRNTEKVTVISQMTCIIGLGGIGKTALARKYIQEYSKEHYDNVIWTNAESEATLIESFSRLAKDKLQINTKDANGEEKDIKSIVEEVYKFFNKRKSLFIFDNAEKDKYLKKFLPLHSSSPEAKKPNILITSRNQEWEKGIEVMNLYELKLKDAIEFVKKGLGIPEEDKSQDQEIESLVEKLQRFPLAIQQAIAYIDDCRVNDEFGISDYLKKYEKKTEVLLNSTIFQDLIENDYAKTTFATWQITIDKISCNEQCGKLALKILDTIAYFAAENISRDIFLNLVIDNEEQLKAAVRLIVKYSMVNGEEKQSILSIHRLVQEVIRINLKGENREEKVLREALKLFNDASSPIDLFDNYLHLSNVDNAMSVWSFANNYKELVKEFCVLPVLIVSELRAAARYQEAYSLGSTALKLLERILGDEHPSTLSVMTNIAKVLTCQGKYDNALEICRKIKEKSHIINVDNMVGVILLSQGKINEAMEIFSPQYSQIKEGQRHSDGGMEHNIAVILAQQDKLDDAMEMFNNALKRKKEVFGPDHENTLITMNNMILVLVMQKKYEDVLKMLSEIYEKRKKILGPNHSDTLHTSFCFALALYDQKKYDEALKIANEVDKITRKLFPEDPLTFKGMLTIVEILEIQGNYDEALEKSKEIYEKRKDIFGQNYFETVNALDTWHCLATRLANQRKYEKALTELNEILKEREKILKPNHPSISQTKHTIDKVCRARDNGTNIKFCNIKLHLAAQKGQLEDINVLLREDIEVNFRTFLEANTPLILASESGNVEVVNALLNVGADVNLENFIGYTSLHYSAQNGHLDVFNALLNRGADVNKIDNEGKTPLHLAAKKGHKNIVESLLKVKDLNINFKTVDGHTALHYAAFFNNAEIIKLLLKNGANVEATDDIDGQTPLSYTQELLVTSIRSNNLQEVINCINKQASIGFTPLHLAVTRCNLELVKLLLESNADVNVKDNDGNTPLDLAKEKLVQDPQNNNLKKITNVLNRKMQQIKFPDNVKQPVSQLPMLIFHFSVGIFLTFAILAYFLLFGLPSFFPFPAQF